MSQLLQADAIADLRGEIDDLPQSKIVVGFDKLDGVQDGKNTTFRIPQERISTSNFIAYKNDATLSTPADYTLTDPIGGTLVFVLAPQVADSLKTTFYFNWFTDIECDHFLCRAGNELGFEPYHTDANTVPGTEQPKDDSGNPLSLADFPGGLKAALVYIAAGRACKALSIRLAVKYDISYGDHSLSPSSMSKQYADLAKELTKTGLTSRDDFYKGQGTQYRPSIRTTGYFLPDFTPKR